jgi:hypothetical protein
MDEKTRDLVRRLADALEETDRLLAKGFLTPALLAESRAALREPDTAGAVVETARELTEHESASNWPWSVGLWANLCVALRNHDAARAPAKGGEGP